jgi:hypothetical protein
VQVRDGFGPLSRNPLGAGELLVQMLGWSRAAAATRHPLAESADLWLDYRGKELEGLRPSALALDAGRLVRDAHGLGLR